MLGGVPVEALVAVGVSERRRDCAELLDTMQPRERALLEWLLRVILEVNFRREANKMTLRNLCVVWAPNLRLLDAASWKDSACSWTAWPWVASKTKITFWGSIAARISCISSKSAASCLWRPLVSTMITSYFSALNCSTPSVAMRTGSASLYDP